MNGEAAPADNQGWWARAKARWSYSEAASEETPVEKTPHDLLKELSDLAPAEAARTLKRRGAETLSSSRDALAFQTNRVQRLPRPPYAPKRVPGRVRRPRYNPHGRDIDDNNTAVSARIHTIGCRRRTSKAAAILETLGNEGLPP